MKLLIFTDNKIFAVEGTEAEHVQGIAEKIYKYIPNIFNVYDPFVVSYEFEKIFHKNPEDFFAIYEEERKKKTLVH